MAGLEITKQLSQSRREIERQKKRRESLIRSFCCVVTQSLFPKQKITVTVKGRKGIQSHTHTQTHEETILPWIFKH